MPASRAHTPCAPSSLRLLHPASGSGCDQACWSGARTFLSMAPGFLCLMAKRCVPPPPHPPHSTTLARLPAPRFGLRVRIAARFWSAVAAPAPYTHLADAKNGRVVLPLLLWRRLEFGHSGWVNPEGCQRVVGGRRGFGGGDLRTAAQETLCTPAGVPDSSLRRLERVMVWQVRVGSGTPPGCSAIRRGFPVVVPPFALNDHRLPSANPPGLAPGSAGEFSRKRPNFRRRQGCRRSCA